MYMYIYIELISVCTLATEVTQYINDNWSRPKTSPLTPILYLHTMMLPSSI